MKKNGELTTQQLVGLIILIASFAVILFLLFRLNLGEESDKEICHNSVIMKSQSKLSTGSLDCKTNYICISGGEKCEGFNPTASLDVKTEEEVMKAIADAMSDCWWMFGEGEVNYLEGWTLTEGHCATCSVIKFDSAVQEKFGFSYEEFYNYLYETKKDESQTYFDYFFGSYYNLKNLDSFESEMHFELSPAPLDLSKRFAVLTGINKGSFYNYGTGYMPAYFVASDEIKTKTLCTEFDITKA